MLKKFTYCDGLPKCTKNLTILQCSIVTCGETFVSSDNRQSFSSPNWPDSYPANQDCYWIIKSDAGKSFDVTLNQGRTEPDLDFVEVSFEVNFKQF